MKKPTEAIERIRGFATLGAPWGGGESYADALDTIAKLKAHAEAMAERLDAWARIDECKCSEVDAYRRDFPKEDA